MRLQLLLLDFVFSVSILKKVLVLKHVCSVIFYAVYVD